MRVECDADTRKIAERHVRQVVNRIRSADRHTEWLSVMTSLPAMADAADDLQNAIDAAPFEPCGWTGDVDDSAAWTCPACLAEHVTPEPDGERDVSPADAAYYADRAADRYEQRLYGGA